MLITVRMRATMANTWGGQRHKKEIVLYWANSLLEQTSTRLHVQGTPSHAPKKNTYVCTKH